MSDVDWNSLPLDHPGTILPDGHDWPDFQSLEEFVRFLRERRSTHRLISSTQAWVDKIETAAMQTLPKMQAQARGRHENSQEQRTLRAAVRVIKSCGFLQICLGNLRPDDSRPATEAAFDWFELGCRVTTLRALAHEVDATRGLISHEGARKGGLSRHGDPGTQAARRARAVAAFKDVEQNRDDLGKMQLYEEATVLFNADEKRHNRKPIKPSTMKSWVLASRRSQR